MLKRAHRSHRHIISNPFAHPGTYVFFLTTFVAAIGKTSDPLHSFSPTFVCAIKSEPYTFATPASPITPEVIAQFIDGAPLDCGFVAQSVHEMRSLNPYLQNYLDFSFTHLQNFKYKIYPSRESYVQGTGDSSTAARFESIRTINNNVITSQRAVIHTENANSRDTFFILDNIRHEARHSALQAAQNILSFSLNPTAECYSPVTSSENAKLYAMVKKGLKNVGNLAEMLDEEREGESSAANRKILNGLRNKCKDEYHKYYQTEIKIQVSQRTVKEIECEQKSQATPGEKFKLPEGDFLIKEIKIPQDDPANMELIGYFLDPLASAAYYIPKLAMNVEASNKDEKYLREIDAYLNAGYPQAIIEFLFPELHAYTNNMINRARWLDTAKHDPQVEHQLYQILTNRNGMFYNPQNSSKIISFAKYAMSQGRYEDARQGLEMLINKGQYKATAHLELARMENKLNRQKESMQHYKIAIKEGAELNGDDYSAYSKLLMPIQPKAAAKYAKKAEELNAEKQQPTRSPR